MIRAVRLILCVYLVIFTANTASAQQLSIAGTVDDGSGVVPDVTVTLIDTTGTISEVTTDLVGKYQIEGLRRGDYQLIVGRDGYASAMRAVVLTEQSRTVDITLQIGALSTSVDVVGAADLMRSAENAVGSRLRATVRRPGGPHKVRPTPDRTAGLAPAAGEATLG
jgi:hypothetical protein